MVSGNKREDLPLSNHTKGDSGVNLIAATTAGHALLRARSTITYDVLDEGGGTWPKSKQLYLWSCECDNDGVQIGWVSFLNNLMRAPASIFDDDAAR